MRIQGKLNHIKKLLNGDEILRIESKIDISRFDNISRIEESKNINKYKTLISCSGCGFSGSSAVTDFLAEFSECTALGGVTDDENRGKAEAYEVDFFRDTYGILGLENIVSSLSRRLQSDFMNKFIGRSFENYNSKCPIYDEYYLARTKQLVDKLLDYKIPLDNKKVRYYLTDLNTELYREIAAEYIRDILGNVSSKTFLVLDQFLTLRNPDKDILGQYFDNYRIIFVWSDPRDIYVRARNHNVDWIPKLPEAFVKHFIMNTVNYLNTDNDNVLCISFDELCYQYDETAKKICDFLGLNEDMHNKKFAYFNPIDSVKNTKLWKDYEDKEAINYIYEKLKMYCWE